MASRYRVHGNSGLDVCYLYSPQPIMSTHIIPKIFIASGHISNQVESTRGSVLLKAEMDLHWSLFRYILKISGSRPLGETLCVFSQCVF